MPCSNTDVRFSAVSILNGQWALLHLNWQGRPYWSSRYLNIVMWALAAIYIASFLSFITSALGEERASAGNCRMHLTPFSDIISTIAMIHIYELLTQIFWYSDVILYHLHHCYDPYSLITDTDILIFWYSLISFSTILWSVYRYSYVDTDILPKFSVYIFWVGQGKEKKISRKSAYWVNISPIKVLAELIRARCKSWVRFDGLIGEI